MEDTVTILKMNKGAFSLSSLSGGWGEGLLAAQWHLTTCWHS